jgi:DNA sulfur modification protein DndD
MARLEGCERNLAAVPHEDSIRSTIEEIQSVSRERERLAIKKDLLADEERKVAAELERKRKARQDKLEKLAKQILSVSTTHRVLKHSERVRDTLGKYREEIAKRHMLRLEKLITECFVQLHRKKSMGHAISIGRGSYELELHEVNGTRISSAELSAGERQLLAVSVLWALARASGRKLPTIIDTPLGRLDSAHRQYLVRNYFPHASHQVILFSTDEEIVDNYYEELKPAIAREYTIVFDEARRSSNVFPGYFAKKALAA